VLAENKLFATLDPSQRRLFVPTTIQDENYGIGGRTVILSDTVGFIRKLPAELENAFRATLEELYDAALLVHVVDAADPDVIAKYQAVRRILDQMSLGSAPELVVCNKIDKADPTTVAPLLRELEGIGVSAAKKIGIGELLAEIDKRVPRISAPTPAYSQRHGEAD
jgi:GTP-binding protein HflX